MFFTGDCTIIVLNDSLSILNSNKSKVYEGTIVDNSISNVKDCSFIYHPDTKRVDFQVVGYIVSSISDWESIVKIPDEILPLTNNKNAYCGTVIAGEGVNAICAICYISPSNNGYLSATGISSVGANRYIKLFGSYYTV